jgi:hypothetical protein
MQTGGGGDSGGMSRDECFSQTSHSLFSVLAEQAEQKDRPQKFSKRVKRG